MTIGERIRKLVEKWFLIEPLLFAAWTTHALTTQPLIKTIRVRQGRIEYNPEFLEGLSDEDLEQVMKFETLRILLKHPYSRQQEQAELTYLASNISLQEALRCSLPFPYAKDVFGHNRFDHQYLEFYYSNLKELSLYAHAEEKSQVGESGEGDTGSVACQDTDVSELGMTALSLDAPLGDGDMTGIIGDLVIDLATYTDAQRSGVENTVDWAEDEFLAERLDKVIEVAQSNQSWGSVAGQLRKQILATLKPQLDYRTVLRRFRASVLSTRRILTRMKPSRRYGFAYLGSRREFDTRLLFAVDVSGSMSSEDLCQGFSIINRFFSYGISSIDVVLFDTKLRGEVVTFKKVARSFVIEGRGGTDFMPVLAHIDEVQSYDGLIVFTDGYCPAPPRPKNRRTRILWLFTHETTYLKNHKNLRHLGRCAFIKPDKR